MDYFHHGTASTDIIFLDIPASFDHSNQKILVKRFKQKPLSVPHFEKLSSLDEPFYVKFDEPESELIAFSEDICKMACTTDSNCYAFLSFSTPHIDDSRV